MGEPMDDGLVSAVAVLQELVDTVNRGLDKGTVGDVVRELEATARVRSEYPLPMLLSAGDRIALLVSLLTRYVSGEQNERAFEYVQELGNRLATIPDMGMIRLACQLAKRDLVPTQMEGNPANELGRLHGLVSDYLDAYDDFAAAAQEFVPDDMEGRAVDIVVAAEKVNAGDQMEALGGRTAVAYARLRAAFGRPPSPHSPTSARQAPAAAPADMITPDDSSGPSGGRTAAQDPAARDAAAPAPGTDAAGGPTQTPNEGNTQP